MINADSAQVYADLAVLSARPGPEDLARADHQLFGTRDAAQPCSAANWAAQAKAVLREVHGRGKLPILVGGTGLYLRTLLDGIAPVPPIEPQIRDKVRSADVRDNHRRLAELDRATAEKLRPSDTTRVARALEVILSTGRSLSAWQAEKAGGIADEIGLHPLLLLPPRPWLNARCDRRFEEMIASGAAGEVERLLRRRLDPDLPAMRAIGVPEIAAMLDGQLTPERAIAAGQLATRRYAKRQFTWFRHQAPPGWPRFAEPLEGPVAMERALALLAFGG